MNGEAPTTENVSNEAQLLYIRFVHVQQHFDNPTIVRTTKATQVLILKIKIVSYPKS